MEASAFREGKPTQENRWFVGALCGAVLIGVGTQVLFGWTAIQLFLFLRDGSSVAPRGNVWGDFLLACFFALPHSLLLVPVVKKLLKRFVPEALQGCLHCAVTCGCLLTLFACWRSSDTVLWQFEGWAGHAVALAFYLSWALLIYSLYLSGMGYQTGWTPWWHWVRGRKLPRREFAIRGLYRWMRHPVYFSFLGLIWFTPKMTLDHLMLTLSWTVYIYLGSLFKDRRLMRYVGTAYQHYAQRVTGFPVIGFGPWGVLPAVAASAREGAACDPSG